ncbi:hypothetical protein [Neobacillus cucumis]|uniref:hypothetical protein n=1 Tax=Neobacillus cucumis TaxID=1740721 RepID=UPI0019664892|nr:hypothetical protein [Neobacillus cucumis]MBM7651770.1 hypothetical protein [Neobacillus cucumis]
MIEPIQVRIVKAIIRDMDDRMGMSEDLRSTDPDILVAMFEKWMELTANELLKDGLIDKPHKPIVDVKTAHFVNIVNRSPYYFQEGSEGWEHIFEEDKNK